MTEPLFFKRPQGLTAGEIAALAKAEPTDLTFIDQAKLAGLLTSTRACVCLAQPRFAGRIPSHVTVLVTAQPYRAFVLTARALFPDALRPSSFTQASGV